MDRAMVHTEAKGKGSGNGCIEWRRNVGFREVPKGLILQIKDRSFSYGDFQFWASNYDRVPNIWTIGGFVNDEMVAFLYGFWNPLERELEVKRFTVDKSLFTIKGNIIKEAELEVEKLGKDFKVKHYYFIARHWRAFLKKDPIRLKLSKLKVLEGE